MMTYGESDYIEWKNSKFHVKNKTNNLPPPTSLNKNVHFKMYIEYEKEQLPVREFFWLVEELGF